MKAEKRALSGTRKRGPSIPSPTVRLIRSKFCIYFYIHSIDTSRLLPLGSKLPRKGIGGTGEGYAGPPKGLV